MDKAITGHGGPYDWETSKLPTFSREPAHRWRWNCESYAPASFPLPPRKIASTHFCYRPSRPESHSAAGRIRSVEKSNDLIRTQQKESCSSSVNGALYCVTSTFSQRKQRRRCGARCVAFSVATELRVLTQPRAVQNGCCTRDRGFHVQLCTPFNS
jgi:hypothetical protein